jgi:uncharacterized protein related to proFAR isomerase
MKEKVLGVCPYCGSSRLVPLILVGGPLAAVDNKNDQCKCLDCGKAATPIEFDKVSDVDQFFEAEESIAAEGFLSIPLLPLEMDGKRSEPKVRALSWDSGGPLASGGAVPIRHYLKERGIANDSEMLLMDIEGFRSGDQDPEALKQLLRRRPSAWLSMGMTSAEDLFDGLYMGAGMVLADTFSSGSLDLFKELHELSDRCLPMVVYDGSVVWRRGGERDLGRVLDSLEEIGYAEIVFFDIRTERPDREALLDLLSQRKGIIIGGGISEADLPSLEARGFRGAIVDPVLDGIGEEE